jgi:hypothetical protein
MTALIDFTIVPGAPEPRPTKNTLTILSTLATGHLPWGIVWHPSLPLSWDYSNGSPVRACNYQFILSCGHTMRPREAQRFVSAGLLAAGKTQHDEDGLVITPTGKAWLEKNWPSGGAAA